jgi:tetratricopeptide (TPR) repeat protein
MSTPSSVDTIRAEAQRLAAAESWSAVVSLLAPVIAGAPGDGEIALLYAEARWRTGEQRAVLAWLPEVVSMLIADGNRAGHRRAVNMLGAASLAVGELDAAASSLGEALELATEADDRLMLAKASNNLGVLANLRGDHELALWHYRIALPTLQRLGDTRGIAESYHNIAITCRDLGELQEADEHELRALEYAGDGSARRVAAMARIGRAEVALRRGDAPFAEMTATMAADELASLGDPLNESDARRLVGSARAARGLADEALEAFARALALAESRGHVFNSAEILRDRTAAWMLKGETTRAREDARAAMALFASLGAAHEVALLQRRIASLGDGSEP